MTRRLISSGSKFEQDIGYSRAVVDGEWVLVSGTTGFNYTTMTIEDDVVAQCEQTLKNIEAALKQAGASFKDVVRVHYLITKAEDFERCWPVVGKAFGDVRPAIVVMVVGLTDPRMKIEIEVTALRRQGPGQEGKRSTAARARPAPRKPATKKTAKQPRRKK
jgi:enamine deaminase RidA (YjgF/YER057c/UK114 family)